MARRSLTLLVLSVLAFGVTPAQAIDWGDLISTDLSDYGVENGSAYGTGVTQNARLLTYHVLTPNNQDWSGSWDITCSGPNGRRTWSDFRRESGNWSKTFKVPRRSRCYIQGDATAIGPRFIRLELTAWRSGTVVSGEPCDEYCMDLRD